MKTPTLAFGLCMDMHGYKQACTYTYMRGKKIKEQEIELAYVFIIILKLFLLLGKVRRSLPSKAESLLLVSRGLQGANSGSQVLQCSPPLIPPPHHWPGHLHVGSREQTRALRLAPVLSSIHPTSQLPCHRPVQDLR